MWFYFFLLVPKRPSILYSHRPTLQSVSALLNERPFPQTLPVSFCTSSLVIILNTLSMDPTPTSESYLRGILPEFRPVPGMCCLLFLAFLLCPSLSPSSFFPWLSFALISLLSPSLLFSASSPGFISYSLIFAFSFTFPASCGCAEIDDSLKCLPQGHCSREGRGGEGPRNSTCLFGCWLSLSPGFLMHN